LTLVIDLISYLIGNVRPNLAKISMSLTGPVTDRSPNQIPLQCLSLCRVPQLK